MDKATVQPGQTLADIAVQYGGSFSALADLAALNGLSPTAALSPGTVVALPEGTYRADEAERPTTVAVTEVTVQPGQSLADIAVQYGGYFSALADLAALNGLSPTAALSPGTVVAIPEGTYRTDQAERPASVAVTEVTVQPGQSLADIAVQHGGSFSALADLAALNGVSLTGGLSGGQALKATVSDKRTARYFSNGGYVPASDTLAVMEGIDYWIIEQDFIVS